MNQVVPHTHVNLRYPICLQSADILQGPPVQRSCTLRYLGKTSQYLPTSLKLRGKKGWNIWICFYQVTTMASILVVLCQNIPFSQSCLKPPPCEIDIFSPNLKLPLPQYSIFSSPVLLFISYRCGVGSRRDTARAKNLALHVSLHTYLPNRNWLMATNLVSTCCAPTYYHLVSSDNCSCSRSSTKHLTCHAPCQAYGSQ